MDVPYTFVSRYYCCASAYPYVSRTKLSHIFGTIRITCAQIFIPYKRFIHKIIIIIELCSNSTKKNIKIRRDCRTINRTTKKEKEGK